jgi:ubiquinone/menaquinone biosynthesis C-methylase UbiE
VNASTLFDYDRCDVSATYAAARALTPRALDAWRAAIGVMLPAGWRKPRLILDVGCGTGRFTPMLADIFDAEVLGIDPSQRMLAQAGEAVRIPRCAFRSGALEALPVEDRSADLVFLSMVFHHVRDWASAHRELQRVLRPGGFVLVRTALKESLEAYLWSRFFPAAVALDRARLPSADEVVTRMTAAGLSLVRHRSVSQRFADNAESYLGKIRLRGLSSFQLISDAEFTAGLDALERYLRTVPIDASAFAEDMNIFSFVKP